MNNFSTGLKMILSLGLIALLAYYTIRLLGRRNFKQSGNQLIKVVSGHLLAPNKHLQVVIVDDKTVLLLGVGANVECVARFDDQDFAQRMLLSVLITFEFASNPCCATIIDVNSFVKLTLEASRAPGRNAANPFVPAWPINAPFGALTDVAGNVPEFAVAW